MKKLMIAACAVAFAAVAQAASVQWQAGAFADLPDCEAFKAGGEGATGYGPDFSTACIQAYIFESTTAYNYADSAAVWAAFQKGEISGTALTPTSFDVNTGMLNVNGLNTYSENDKVYAAIVYVHSDTGDFAKPDFYIANVAEGTATLDGGTVMNLSNSWGGAGGASIGWQAAAVPEPTSGLLLLLGVAGLALRRRRA